MAFIRRPLRIGFVGWGAIAHRVAELMAQVPDLEASVAVVAVRSAHLSYPDIPPGAALIDRPAALAEFDLDMVIEAAGREAVFEWGEDALRKSGRFVVCSTSAFCDIGFLDHLLDVARKVHGQVVIPPGALAGVETLRAVSIQPLDEVVHRIVKPPGAWKDTKAEEFVELDKLKECTVIFSGSAREAADLFPQNANVAVITALAGIGLERTRLVLAADPAIRRNHHIIEARGAFGQLKTHIENEPLARNRKSSETTALNVLRLIRNGCEAFVL